MGAGRVGLTVLAVAAPEIAPQKPNFEPSLQAHTRGASVAWWLRCTQWDPKRQPQAFFKHQAALNETEGDETAVCTQ